MTKAPPNWLEKIVVLAIPPRVREDVLGDLHELYKNPFQYASEVCHAVPRLAWTEIRRTFSPGLAALEGLVIVAALLEARTAGEWRSYREAFWVYLFWTPMLVTFVLTLLRAYRPPRAPARPFVEPGFAVTAGVAANTLMRGWFPEVSLPFWPAAVGGCAAWTGLAVVRCYAETGLGHLATPTANPPEFWSGEHNSTLGMYFGPFMLLIFGWQMSIESYSPWGGLAMVALASWCGFRIYSVRIPSDLYGEERRVSLKRRRKVLNSAGTWYLGPMFCACVMFVAFTPQRLLSDGGLWLKLVYAGITWFACWTQARHVTRKAVEEIDQELEGGA